MQSTVFLKDMTWPEVQQAIQENRLLIFAVGTMEQHGHHMPLGVDIYLPEEVARRVAEACGAVVAPVTQYGYKSLLRAGGGPHFPGSIGLRGATLIAMVKDLMEGYLAMGWRRFLVLDWHLENVPFVYEGVDEALRASGLGETVKIVKIDNPNGLGVAAMPGLDAELFGDDFPGWAVEHAAIWETSAMLAARPDLVRQDLIVDGEPPAPFDYDILPVPSGAAPKSGVFWKATRASQEKGIKILEATTKGILQVIHKEFTL